MYIKRPHQFYGSGFLRNVFKEVIKIQINKYGIDNIQFVSILCEPRLFNNANVIPAEFSHRFTAY